ncbi:hypothetical protein V498_08105 [Pseudogymnoascus sp. VKM F-4517 (FW-2822)]|nr:hypothetical protein V498_08105 [Pseudogymnoascus sp. VKM F-4517 (FW-2822)]
MSSQGRSASSGVRNLRAMFENKDDSTTSPPQNRGRSPAPSIGNNSASPRQLSKVRTSFVAVERNGQTGIQWGLRKETTVPPEDSTMSHRRGSFAENESTDPDVVIERKKSIQEEFKARKNSVDISETIPEFALEMPSAAASKQGTPAIESKDPMPAANTPTGNPDKPSTVEERNAKLLPADVKSAATVSGGKALKGASGLGEDLKGVTTGKLKTGPSTKPSDKSTASKSSRPAPISTTKTSTLSKTTKSPALPKTPVSGTSAKSSTRTTATAATKASKPAVEKTTRPSTTTTKPAAPSTRTNPATKKPSLPSSTGFIKPRPKSPTKPAKLPSSLTAPTSSSLSKLADEARRTSAGSTRSPSRVSAGKSETIRKPTSSRPSLGPPPSAALKKQTSRQSLPKPSAPADEGFLARMMRPTTASASKTHDKAATPPKPKLQQERPGTRNGQNARGESSGSPVSARPPVPTAGAVPTLKPLGAKATAGKSVAKKAEVSAKKEVSVPAPVEAVKAAEPAAPAVEEKTEEPAAEAEAAPEPAVPVEEPVVVEEAVEKECAAPATIAEETVPAKEAVEIDEPAPAVDIEEVEEVAPVEEAVVEEVAAETAAPVEEVVEETTEEVTEEAASEVPAEDEPVITDKVDVEAVIEDTEELAVTDKVDVAAVVEETEEEEAKGANVEADEVPVVVEAETKTAAEETPAVVEAETEAEAGTAEADEAEDVVEPATTTAEEAKPEKTPAKEEKTEVEIEDAEDAVAASDVTTPAASVAPVVAL